MRKLLTLLAFALAAQGSAFAGMDEALKYYDAGNIEFALKELKPLAEAGDANAQYMMAAIYDRGTGIATGSDEQQALYWYRQAAAKDQAQAQYQLGLKYGQGRGVAKDSRQEIFWYRKAAEQGNADAQYNLSVMLGNGQGAPQDLRQSAFWCRQAAEQGHVPAIYNLGLMYREGKGVPLNDVNAYLLLNLAAGKGHVQAERYKNVVAKNLSRKEVEDAQSKTSAWKVGTALPLSPPRS